MESTKKQKAKKKVESIKFYVNQIKLSTKSTKNLKIILPNGFSKKLSGQIITLNFI